MENKTEDNTNDKENFNSKDNIENDKTENPNNGFEELKFEKLENRLKIYEERINDIEKKLSLLTLQEPEIKQIEIDKIERLKIMEEKYKITFNGLYAYYTCYGSDIGVNVLGEIESTSDTSNTLEKNIFIEVVVYDSKERIIGHGEELIPKETFFKIRLFQSEIDLNKKKPYKVKIYPAER
jgi:DNA repair ATPase RecN